MNRRLSPALLTLATAIALVLPATAAAQVRPGVHYANARKISGGSAGVGASVTLGFPLLPIEVMAAGDYFFPDCSGCKFWGGSLDVHLKAPFPILTPYALGGLVYRRSTLLSGDIETTGSNSGFALGAGVNLGAIALGAYAEARYEFVDPEHQLMLRLGLRF